jgi:hypothetical protein
MANEYEIERSEPSMSRCECCGGLTVRLTRFVTRNEDAFAIYYAAYSNNHPDGELAMLVALGEWAEDSDPAQRAAFFCRVRVVDGSYQVMLGDAAESPWRDAAVVGQKLSRAEALVHPWKATAFEVLDEAFEQDPSLKGFVGRARCGDLAEPLERNYGEPDDIFALGKDKGVRAKVSRSFCSLDGERFFVRCLLPIPVEGYRQWTIGLWLEVARAEHDRAAAVWDDPERYPALRFSGVIANDVRADLDLPIALGSKVEVAVRDADAAPFVAAARRKPLQQLLSATWSKADFEKYAVERGFL